VNVIFPAAVSLIGTANVGTVFNNLSDVNVVLAVAARIEVADEPAEVPMATVPDPDDVTAVVTLMVPPVIIVLSGMLVVTAGVIVETAPPSTAKL